MKWQRYANSRLINGAEYFGQAQNWRHEYDWNLRSGSAINGQDRLIAYQPDGSAITFLRDPANANRFVPPATVGQVITVQSGIYTLQKVDGSRYQFTPYTDSSGTFYPGTWFQMSSFQDAKGNVTSLTYSSTSRTALLQRVTDASGRYIDINWHTYPVSEARRVTVFKLVASSFNSDAWQEITGWSNPGWRSTLVHFPEMSYGNIAEIEFYDDSNNLITTGAQISSGPTVAGHDISKAFDGDPDTYVEFVSPSNNWLGLDFGSGATQKISKVRFKARTGYGSRLASTVFSGNNTVASSITVIQSAESSTGLSVEYEYSSLEDTVLDLDWLVLTGTHYNDDTQAIYSVAQIYAGSRPVVTEAVDPRHEGNGKHIKYIYNPEGPIGYIRSESDGATNEPIATLDEAPSSHTSAVSHPNGALEFYDFGKNGNVKYQTDGLGRTINYTYETVGGVAGTGYLTSQTNPAGNVTTYTRSPFGQILTEVLPDGTTTTWTRDSLDLPLTQTVTGPGIASRTTTWTRDSQHRVTRIDHPDTSYETFTYNSYGQVLTHRLRNGGTESFAYDSTGLRTSSTDALGNVTTYSYDANDRLASVTNPRGLVTSFAYDDRGLVTEVTLPDSSSRTMVYNDFGNKISETDELGHTTTFQYDSYQRLVSRTDPLNRTTTLSYALGGGGCGGCNTQDKPTVITLPSGKTTTHTYDLEWQLISTTTGSGTADAATTTNAYDSRGNVTSVTDPLGRVWISTYDSRSRRITQKDPQNYITSMTYDAVSNVLTTTRPDSGVTTNTYDKMNRLLTTQNPKLETTSFAYDDGDNMISMTDAKSNTYTFDYDLLNRRIAFNYPGTGISETWSYDDDAAAGSVWMVYTARDGSTMSCTYDNRGRETFCDYSDTSTPDVTNTYDAAGRKLSCSTSVVAHTYTYDDANQLLSETSAIAALSPTTFTVSYTYDSDGNRASLTYPDASVVNYTYTNRNQVKEVKRGSTILAAYTYDLNGNRTGKAMENDADAFMTYDTKGQMTLLEHKKGTTILAAFGYSYNSVGNRTAKVVNMQGAVRTESYTYDAVDQVTGVNYGNSRTEGFVYDAVGNRTSSTDSATTTTSYTANNLNQYTAVGSDSVTYDSKGNLTQQGSGLAFAYDSKNRLLSATGTGVAFSQTYDCANKVVGRTLNGTTTYMVYDGWSLIAEVDSSGAVLRKFVHGVVIDEILVKTEGSADAFYHHDALGSTVLLTDDTGAVQRAYEYDAFGKLSVSAAGVGIHATGTFANRFLYTGREWLDETGLYDYRNRVYSAALGRFLQTDPIRFEAGDGNLYRYVGNRTINLIDPLGLDPCVVTNVRKANTRITTWKYEIFSGHYNLFTGKLGFIDYVEFDLYTIITLEGHAYTLVTTYECTNSCGDKYKRTDLTDGYERKVTDVDIERRNVKYANGEDTPIKEIEIQ